ncbi:MAG: hypothetical protein RXQ77_02725 [Candidatus Nanopusillus sp.]
MRGKIFDDFMMFIGYYLPIFIIILAGIIFILTSIFKFYHINNPSQYYISIQNQNNQNNQNSNQNTINSTIMVNIYYQNGYDIYYVPSFIENLSNWSIFYNITNTYSISSSNFLNITPLNITNINSTSFDISSSYNAKLESIINLSNNTFEGNIVKYTYNKNTYECKIIGNNVLEYQAGDFVYFCILCKSTSNQNIGYSYLNEPEYLNITPAISLLNSYPNTQYYNYTINNVEIVNGTYLAIPLSNSNRGYSMEDFQNILVTIGPPLSNYINTTPYVGDNVVFILNYDGKYYVLPSWYAGKSNGNYYFFINLLNIPSLYNNNFGCNIISIFVGFSNENLLKYLNGTIGGAPEALNSSNPSSAIIYDNGLNVFPIYVNFYPYNGNLEEQNISCNNGFEACFNNTQYNNVLPPYNNVNIYLNGSQYNEVGTFLGPLNIEVVTNGPLQGLLMDNGTNQGSYALITSNVLQNTFNQLVSLQSQEYQNGLGLQTFAYFSGIPWEDPQSAPSSNFLIGYTPDVSDAVVLSYVSYNNQFTADTVIDYNHLDFKMSHKYALSNPDIGICVGGDTYLPLGFPVFTYEYGWNTNGPCHAGGAGHSSGYYVGILQYNSSPAGPGYFLTTQYNNNYPCSLTSCEYYDYYYSGSGWSGGHLNYYFLEDNTGDIQGYSGSYCSKNNQFCDIFAPPDQQKNKTYYQYGVFWLYNWFQIDFTHNNNMNIFFLMNGNIFNYSLALEQYKWNGGSAYAIPPNPPASTNTITGEPIFVQSYINAYNTAFNQTNINYQYALYKYGYFYPSDVNNNFIKGTFGFHEEYDNTGELFKVKELVDNINNNYIGIPYLFVSTGSGGGSGFMYLNWIIVTYGVPYVISIY